MRYFANSYRDKSKHYHSAFALGYGWFMTFINSDRWNQLLVLIFFYNIRLFHSRGIEFIK